MFKRTLQCSLKSNENLFRREDNVIHMSLMRSGLIALGHPMVEGSNFTMHIVCNDLVSLIGWPQVTLLSDDTCSASLLTVERSFRTLELRLGPQ